MIPARLLVSGLFQSPCMPLLSQILIADDDASQIILLKLAIERANLPAKAFVFFSNGAELKNHLEKLAMFNRRPDLLVVDLNMPLMDGFEVIEWVRLQRAFASLPIIVMSSTTESGDRERAKQLGSDRFLNKTADIHELIQLLTSFYYGGVSPHLADPGRLHK